MNKYAYTLYVLFMFALNVSVAGPQPSFDIQQLNIKVGMKRSELENKIAKYTVLKSDYSAQYPTESSTKATYTIKTVNLHVTYKEGAPAPYIKNNDGSIVHFQPIEQTVLTWGIDE